MKKQYQKPCFSMREFCVSDIITSSSNNPFNIAMEAMKDTLEADDQRYIESVKYGEWN